MARVALKIERDQSRLLATAEVESGYLEPLALGKLGQPRGQELGLDAVVEPERLQGRVPEGLLKARRERREQLGKGGLAFAHL